MSNENDKPEGWLDFKKIKAEASMPVVLKYLKLAEHLEQKEDEWVGFCPFHPEKGKADSFHASESKKAFHCFACKRKGSVLDLVQLLLAHRGENLTLREAAEWIKDRMEEGGKEEPIRPEAESREVKDTVEASAQAAPEPPPARQEERKPEEAIAPHSFDASGIFLNFAEACRLVSFGKAHARDFVAVRVADLMDLLQSLSPKKE